MMLSLALFIQFWSVAFARFNHGELKHGIKRGAGRERIGFNPNGAQSQPNILYILMDDMGYGDISARGAEFDTPNMDALYEESIVLNYHYIGLVCSPTRSQLLSGRYAWRYGLSNQKAFADQTLASLPSALPTLGNLLLEYTNYQTYYTGKWHIGMGTFEHTPLYRGWNEFHGFYSSGIDYETKIKKSADYWDNEYYDWMANLDVDYDTQPTFSTYVTEQKIEQLIETNELYNKENDVNDPWFVFASFQTPHMPLESVIDYGYDCSQYAMVNEYRDEYCTHMLMVDDVIGTLTTYLKSNDYWDNTLIIFTSDNGGGGRDNQGTCNFPLRGQKDHMFEGGIRTIAFLTGGYIPDSQMGTERNEFMHVVDWVPTLLSIAGADVDEIESDLQEVLYKPMSEAVSLTVDGNTDNSNNYLLDTSFDGYDLSEWLINGKTNKNKRDTVPLSINSYNSFSPSMKYDVENEINDDINFDINPILYETLKKYNIKFHTNDVGPSEKAVDYPNGDVVIIFTSSVTGKTYKFMYLTEMPEDIVRRTYCTYSDSMLGKVDALNGVSKIDLSKEDKVGSDDLRIMCEDQDKKTYNTNKLLFDLYNDPTEEINLFDDLDTSGENEIIAVYNEALDLVDEYLSELYFNDLIDCHATPYYNISEPNKFNSDALLPWFTWDEYVEVYSQDCEGELANEAVKLLYFSQYDDYVSAYQAKIEKIEKEMEEFEYYHESGPTGAPKKLLLKPGTMLIMVLVFVLVLAAVCYEVKQIVPSTKTVDTHSEIENEHKSKSASKINDVDEYTPLNRDIQLL